MERVSITSSSLSGERKGTNIIPESEKTLNRVKEVETDKF